MSDTTKEKISKTHTGMKHSLTSRQKISNAKKGITTWMAGRKHTEESIKKMSESHKGNTAHLGHHHSEEVRMKMRGRKVSEETRQKISAV